MKEKVILLSIGNNFPRWEEQFHTLPPLGILALGSYLAAHHVPVELIDVQMDFGFGLTSAAEQVIAGRVARYLHHQADSIAWVGISQISNNPSGIMLAQEIHAALPETPIILGGYFPSCSYQLLLRKHPFLTAIVRGDGEAAALQISRSLAQGQSFLCDQTPNLAWLQAGEIQTTPIQPMDLNHLPILDFRLLRNRSCYQTGSLMTSRGCPFHCSYCTEQSMRHYAPYPVEWVARQLEHLEATVPWRHTILSDPLFGVGRERTRAVCQIMSQHGFTYATASRVDVVTPDMIPTFRQAGIEFVFWGIESASPSTLMRMNKVRSEGEAKRFLDNALKLLRACFENNIVPEVGLMISFPGDTEADLQASLEFVKTVEQIHDEVAAQTGIETGFVSYSQPTAIYAGAPLTELLEKDFEVILGDASFEDERTVLSPSPSLDPDTIYRYAEQLNQHGRFVPQVGEMISKYISFSGENFVATHPALTDEQGVTMLCDKLRSLHDPA